MRDDGYPFAEWFGDEPIDGTYGYDLPALLAVEPADPPAGFQSFWRGLRAHARATAPDPSLTPIEPIDGRPMWLVEHTGADGLRLRAWLALPASGTPRVGVVHSHGYGGRDAPAFERVPDDAAAIFPVAIGAGPGVEGAEHRRGRARGVLERDREQGRARRAAPGWCGSHPWPRVSIVSDAKPASTQSET